MSEVIIPTLIWDMEAQDHAMRTARQISHRDPEAAALLMAQVVAVQESAEQRGEVVSRSPVDYNPTALYEQLANLYHWTPMQINEMHYLMVFGVVREGNDRRTREKDEQERLNNR